MSIRAAQPSDLDAITWISVAATPLDPVCPYRFPYRDQYPEDFEHYTRIRLAERLAEAATGTTNFIVYEAPSIEDSNIRKVISYAIWELPKGHIEIPETKAAAKEVDEKSPRNPQIPKSPLDRRDANPAHVRAYSACIHTAKITLFDNIYGANKYFYLALLNTHPDYQRRGAGTALCAWGMEKAKGMGWCVTLFTASRMGRGCYGGLGFVGVGGFRMGVEGEVVGMVWEGGMGEEERERGG